MSVLRRAVRACAFYPVTWTYVAGVAVILAMSADVVNLGGGLIMLSFLAVLIALVFTHREVHEVHLLVNSQRELIERIEQLIAALDAAGVGVPAEKAAVP